MVGSGAVCPRHETQVGLEGVGTCVLVGARLPLPPDGGFGRHVCFAAGGGRKAGSSREGD